ncbi:MAG: preprotein translocase subunit YajC [Acidimicrobiales bacterium]
MYSLITAVLAVTKTTTSAGSPVGSLIFILAIGLAAYVFFIRPRSQAARRQRDTMTEISPGDEVLTGAGIFGTVLDVSDDRVTIETAPGTHMTVLRSTIARRLTGPSEEESPDTWYDEQHEPAASPAEPGEGGPDVHDHGDHPGHDGDSGQNGHGGASGHEEDGTK